jgi:hypothetical protein
LKRHDAGAARTRSDLEERMLSGWRVLRVSYERLTREPEWVGERAAEALRA